jgi:hypothetical protein
MLHQATHTDYLDDLALQARQGNDIEFAFDMLGKGEQAYVALAANSAALLKRMDYTIAEAIYRLGWDQAHELVGRWRFRR